MNMHRPDFVAAKSVAPAEYVCWTRMQAEAGQALDRIIARKEIERELGDGLFFWGVGNPPAKAAQALSRLGVEIPIIFSVMKSRPKTSDVWPSAVVAWTHYLDSLGVERTLPEHVLVTSRRDSASGPKTSHYALMCLSAKPLSLERGSSFDPTAYRNVGGNGAPVGASQVTALLHKTGEPQSGEYEVNMRAKLTGSYWVKLTRPVEVSSSSLERVAAEATGPSSWLSLVHDIRSRECQRRGRDLLHAIGA